MMILSTYCLNLRSAWPTMPIWRHSTPEMHLTCLIRRALYFDSLRHLFQRSSNHWNTQTQLMHGHAWTSRFLNLGIHISRARLSQNLYRESHSISAGILWGHICSSASPAPCEPTCQRCAVLLRRLLAHRMGAMFTGLFFLMVYIAALLQLLQAFNGTFIKSRTLDGFLHGAHIFELFKMA